MFNWINDFFILIIFIIEIIIAHKVFRTTQQRGQSSSSQQPFLLVVYQSNPHRKSQQGNIFNGNSDSPSPMTPPQIILSQSRQSQSRVAWEQIAVSACIGSIFLSTFLVINFLLRPFTFFWTLCFLPILLPIPFLTIPYFLKLRIYSTTSFLVCGLGLGVLTLLFL